METAKGLKKITQNALYKIGDLINLTRKEKGLNLAKLYELSGISSSIISDLENHKGATPNIHTLIAIANALELPKETFIKIIVDSFKECKKSDKINALKIALTEYGLPSKYLEPVIDYINHLMLKQEKAYTVLLNKYIEKPKKDTSNYFK